MKIILTLSLIKPFKMFPLIVLNYSKYYVPKKINVDQNHQYGGTYVQEAKWCHSLEPDLADLAGKNLGFLWHFTSDCGWDHF